MTTQLLHIIKLATIMTSLLILPSNLKLAESTTTSPLDSDIDPDLPTCIVGGGISGLSVALLLQKKGHNVHLFEKKSIPGGKMVTFRIRDEVQVEMCPLFFGSWQDSVLKYVNEFSLTPVPYNMSDIMGFDPTSGHVGPLRELTREQKVILKETLGRYLTLRSQHERDLSYKFEYTQVSPDLFIPIGQWLDLKNLSALKPVFWFILTIQGYGALEDTPTLYALKLANEEHISASLSPQNIGFTLKEGLDILARRMAGNIRNLYLNHNVERITRGSKFNNNSHPSLRLTSFDRRANSFQTTLCGRVILAFPPISTNVAKIVSDLTWEEKGVLDHVKIHKYTSGAHIIPNLRHNMYFAAVESEDKWQRRSHGARSLEQTSPKGQGEIVGLTRQSSKNLKNVYSSYSWIRGVYTSTPTQVELLSIQRQMEKTLQKISPGTKILFQETSEYFPHVRTKSLEQNFYKKFQKIQGRGGLYYAATLLGFEIMDSAIKMTDAFVSNYF